MKYTVLKPFKDKHTGEKYSAGDIKEFTAKRVKSR